MHPDIERHRAGIEALCREYGVTMLDVFGSATRDDFDVAHSDFDFLVEFSPSMPGMAALDQYFGFKEDLEASLGRSVARSISCRERSRTRSSERASRWTESRCMQRDVGAFSWGAEAATGNAHVVTKPDKGSRLGRHEGWCESRPTSEARRARSGKAI